MQDLYIIFEQKDRKMYNVAVKLLVSTYDQNLWIFKYILPRKLIHKRDDFAVSKAKSPMFEGRLLITRNMLLIVTSKEKVNSWKLVKSGCISFIKKTS